MTDSAAPRFTPMQLLGAIVAAGSLVLAFAPPVQDLGPAPDLFEATERHVRWGLGVGIGGAFAVGPWRRPWSVLVAWLALCLSGGYLLARFVGIAMEGPSDLKQWMLVGVEIAICGVAALWIRHKRGAPERGEADPA